MSAAPRIHIPEIELAADVFGGRTSRDTFVILLAKDFWPVVIYPRGVTIPGKDKKIAEGKEPIDKAWGLERWTLEKANAKFREFKGAGGGVCLGPGRAPGGRWLIDAEGDGPEAEASRAILYGGEDVLTLGWGSTRGGHRLLTVDQERIVSLLAGMKSLESKEPNGAGVYKSDQLPGLELRIGGYKSDGATVKQVQSVVPPTPGTDGRPRLWTGPFAVAAAPEAFYETLEGLAAKPKPKVATSPFGGTPLPPWTIAGTDDSDEDKIARYRERYVLTALFGEAEKVAGTSLGNRHNVLRDASMNMAGLIKGANFSEAIYRRILIAAAEACCLPDGDAVELIESAIPLATPRDMTRAWAWRPSGGVERNGRHEADGKADGTPPGSVASEPSKTRPGRQRFSNYHYEKGVDEEGKATSKPAPNTVQEIDESLSNFAPGWPKRVQDSLFIGTPDHEPVYLGSSTRLFAWIDRQAQVDWTKGGRYITQERFYEHKRMTAERYEAIEVMPHTPSLPGIYYMHRDLPEPSGKLEMLLDYFSPATEIDRQLIKAMISTPSWGAHPGHRPGFMVTGPEHDPEQGRGLGKTELVSIVSDQIYGGYIDVCPTDDISDVKTRLLTDDSTIKRIVRLDNVKTLKFSWADLESLITASEISGRALYKGEGRRPNTIVWFITLNGATLSKDMAQRVIPIKLRRPEMKAGWLEEVKAFATDNRWEILADVAEFLRRDPGPLKAITRWASWERDILSKLDQAERCQKEITDRQGRADDDNSDRDNVRDYFAAMISARKRDPDRSCIFIPSIVAAEWLSEATRKHFETNKSSAHINGLGIAELIQTRESKRRGFIWNGREGDPGNLVDLDEVDEENNTEFAGTAGRKRRMKAYP